MLRTQIQLTEQQAAALRTRAAAKGVSPAEAVRRCVNQMPVSPAAPEPGERRQRAVAIAGRFHSAAADLAVNHDKYLAETFSFPD